VRYGYPLEPFGYDYPVGGTIGMVGAILLADALGYLRNGTRP
jgi:hypothetical protein